MRYYYLKKKYIRKIIKFNEEIFISYIENISKIYFSQFYIGSRSIHGTMCIPERCFEHIVGPVYEMMRKCNLLEYKNGLFAAFPTVADAVHFAKCNTESSSMPAWSSSMYEDTVVARL